MTDVWDQATEREEQFRENALQAARSHADESPDLGCDDCHGATLKGKDCPYVRGCIEDWEKKEIAKRRNGHGI